MMPARASSPSFERTRSTSPQPSPIVARVPLSLLQRSKSATSRSSLYAAARSLPSMRELPSLDELRAEAR